ncbi:5-oxoprolinase subunit C family protein [Gehongia tenuis]|uniref:Biotin-dependent carboxyltransferase family protein n=1 Tax=Gehongia tenuis TaxID=2763655 RepID=A0A926D6H3_9FIRM|nr:biotin-dependent carboxyltransferase family protein [Gehongia tenuis]MBC8532242.1 biotin-dependent carboxyltransferase family protein [Gehongia tenuis]
MGIEILEGGFFSTVQDGGRHAYQQYGMPVGGAMDTHCMALANILVGNPIYTEVLEMTYTGMVMRFHESNFFAVVSHGVEIRLSGTSLLPNRAYLAQKGDTLSIGTVTEGCRAYLALAGGLNLPEVMGSKSTYIKGKLGGYYGRKLRAGDRISFLTPKTQLANADFRAIPASLFPKPSPTLRVILGPQLDAFTPEGVQTFLQEPYTVSANSDRMGYRFSGPFVAHKPGINGNIISDAIAFGAVQVPGEGHPIVMMADRQTTGGYTKIANVISVDLPALAQMRPGQNVHFQPISLGKAHELLARRSQQYALLQRLLDHEVIEKDLHMRLQVESSSYQVDILQIG